MNNFPVSFPQELADFLKWMGITKIGSSNGVEFRMLYGGSNDIAVLVNTSKCVVALFPDRMLGNLNSFKQMFDCDIKGFETFMTSILGCFSWSNSEVDIHILGNNGVIIESMVVNW